MVVKRKKKRTKAPEELPSRYVKSKSGRSYSYVIETKDRDHRGVTLYKLQSLMFDYVDTKTGVVLHLSCSEKRWTAEELLSSGRFLKNPPTKAMIEAAKALPYA